MPSLPAASILTTKGYGRLDVPCGADHARSGRGACAKVYELFLDGVPRSGTDTAAAVIAASRAF